MIYVDVHVELLLTGDDGWIDQSRACDFVPHIAGQRIFIQVLRDRSACLGNGSLHFRSEAGLDRNINRRDGKFFPGRTQDDASRFRIKPPIELAPGVDSAAINRSFVRVQSAAHEHELFRERRYLRVKLQS